MTNLRIMIYPNSTTGNVTVALRNDDGMEETLTSFVGDTSMWAAYVFAKNAIHKHSAKFIQVL